MTMTLMNLLISFFLSSSRCVQILKVEAEDGDKGVPREIRYGLVSENNPFTSFFNINDTTGEWEWRWRWADKRIQSSIH